MKQPGLIDCLINALGLDDIMAKGRSTPAEYVTLVNNQDGVPPSCILNYSSIVGIMIYLSGDTRPEIDFAVNFCAMYMFCSKHSHGEVLKLIGRYLKLTRDCGLILNPNRDLFKIYGYPDADFSGIYGNENPTYPSCVKSCTGYVTTFHLFLFYGNQSYIKRQPSGLQRKKLLL